MMWFNINIRPLPILYIVAAMLTIPNFCNSAYHGVK